MEVRLAQLPINRVIVEVDLGEANFTGFPTLPGVEAVRQIASEENSRCARSRRCRLVNT